MSDADFIKLYEMYRNYKTRNLAVALVRSRYESNKMDVYSKYMLYVIFDDDARKQIDFSIRSQEHVISSWREFCDYTEDRPEVREKIITIFNKK